MQPKNDFSGKIRKFADFADCDLDTLSALLEEDDDIPSNDAPCQSSAGGDDCDLDTLSAMLEEDSAEEEQETENENSCEKKSPPSSNIGESRLEDSSHEESTLSSQRSCDASPHTSTNTTSTNDTEHVKKLQDELLMMQQRMMQIQQMLASQSSSSTTISSSSPVEQLCDVKEEQKVKGSSKGASTLSSAPPPSSKTNSNSKEKRKPASSPASAICNKKLTPASLSPKNGMVNKNKDNAGHQLHNPSTPKLHNSSNPQPNPCSSTKSSDSGTQRQNRLISSLDVSKKQCHTSATGSSVYTSKTVSKGKGLKAVENCERRQKASTFLADVANNECETKTDKKSLKQNLFGEDDSDSDWEDSVENKSQLSDSGMDIKRLLSQGQKQREAHTPSYPLSQYAKTPTWKTKVGVSPSQTGNGSQNGAAAVLKSPSSTAIVKKEADDKDCMTEKYSGLRIKNPKVSSVMLSSKMEGRRMIQISRLPLKIKSPELQGDWVTIGVIVKKSESRKSQTGKTYSIWKLSDLQDAGTTVSFFLFGNVYKQLWKMDVGNVLGILNPSIMDNAEKGSGELAFTVNNALQVMEIGQSKDLGWCLAKTKNGNTCSNFVNRKLGDFCTYHVQAAYRKHSSKRGELHGSCPGRAPKASLKDKILQNNTFFYGGESFSAVKGKGNGSKDRVTMAKLQSVLTQQDQRKVNTLAVQNLMPSDKAKVQATLSSEHEQPFLNMLAVPTAGSMNLVRHIAKSEEKPKGGVKGSSGSIQSVMAADLLKQHREEMAERLHIQKQKQMAKQDTHNAQSKTSGHSEPRVANNGAMNQNDKKRTASRLENDNGAKKVSNGGQSSKKTGGGNEARMSDQSGRRQSNGESKVQHTVTTSVKTGLNSLDQQKTQSSEKTSGPMIGKGFYPGGDIDLFAEPSGGRFQRKPSSADEAKARAVQKLNALGGVEKMDPNAVRSKKPNLEKIKKRVLDNNENENKTQKDNGSHESGCEPARKKSRLLGNIDLSSQEVKQLLNAKSSHTGALAQAEADREERYFDNLEKKEMMEEKMKTVISMEVTVFTCEQCKYTAMSQADRCKQERHAVRRHKGKRRFFACKKCKHRTVTLQRYPSSRCTKCGEHSYEKTSMYHEKSGPKLESETLCLRGDESKFVNAMDQKVFMATLQPDA